MEKEKGNDMRTQEQLEKAIDDTVSGLQATIEKFESLIAKKDFDHALDVANEIQNTAVGLVCLRDIIDL